MSQVIKKKYNRPDQQRIYDGAVDDGFALVLNQVKRNLIVALDSLGEVPGLGEKTIDKVNRHIRPKCKDNMKQEYKRPDYRLIYDQGIRDGAMLAKPKANQYLIERLNSLYDVPGLGEKTIEKVVLHLHQKISKR